MHDRSALLAQLTRSLAATPPETPLPLRLCTAMAKVLGLQGGAMTVELTAPSRVLLCATDDFGERLDDLQDVLGEGPAIDAHRLRQPVIATPDELPSRWPILARSLAEQLTPAFLLAVPMCPADQVLGVLTLHGQAPMSPEFDLSETQYLANAIAVTVLGSPAGVEVPDELWLVRDRVNQAVGIVVAQLRIGPDDALAVLRAHAFAHSTSLADIAHQVLDGRLDFQSDDDPSGSRGDG